MPASKVKVVYLGVPLEEFSRAATADEIAAARARARHRAGRVRRSARSRGCTSRKATRFWSTRPRASSASGRDARFFLVGEGPLRPDSRRRRRALGLGDRFVFAGFRRDVARTLSAFDLSVFPSLWEGTPLTAFEALAMGKPIVATDADGLLDILTDGHDARDRPEARMPPRWPTRSSGRSISPTSARALGAAARADRPAVRHRRVRPQDGAALHAAPRDVARHAAAGVLRADLSFLTSGVSG